MPDQMTRRRVIHISAAAAGFALLPWGRTRAAATIATVWRGTALGAAATIEIHHPDRAFAQRLITRAVHEVDRFERMFSLYREDSELVALNKRGALAAPSPELVALLAQSQHYAQLTGGSFDVTVQPLWSLYAHHFNRPGASPGGPDPDAIAAAVARVGYRRLLVNRDRIAFGTSGMAVTLNGIGQGYITDRIVALFRAEGITQTLVDLGETRCLGTHPDGRPWRVGIADPGQPDRIRHTLAVVDQAVATSGGYGFRFDRSGRFNHLLDPVTGGSARAYRSVTVVAPTATGADALSTAFSLMSLQEIDGTLAGLADVSAYLIRQDGTTLKRPRASS